MHFGAQYVAYGLPVNASCPGSPQAHASLGSGWRPTLAGWDWIPIGFRTRFRRLRHVILSPLTGLSPAHALVHDFGTTGVPNSILDKPGTLTRAEFDRVELHTMLTEQMLRRSPALAALNPLASAHHEKADGSGYHKRLHADAADQGAGVLAAADIYVALTRRSPHPAHLQQDRGIDSSRRRSLGHATRRRPRCHVTPKVSWVNGSWRRFERRGESQCPAEHCLQHRLALFTRCRDRGMSDRLDRFVVPAQSMENELGRPLSY